MRYEKDEAREKSFSKTVDCEECDAHNVPGVEIDGDEYCLKCW